MATLFLAPAAPLLPVFMNRTPPSSSASSREAIRTLVGEYLDQKRRETGDASLAEAPQRVRKGLLLVAFVTCSIVWILPSFYQPPKIVPSAERVDASARVTVFLAAERVRAFQRAKGRLPMTLIEAGVDTTGLSYFRSTNTGFDLWTTANGERVAYSSTTSPVDFLGTALQTLTTSR